LFELNKDDILIYKDIFFLGCVNISCCQTNNKSNR
jgi:hypothetical protein